ncbi:GAF domain-containing protein [Streptomyces polyrhachis]|uniref:GAF domain-containing protein n=1 Tax=Streptomyces polyrhachis TaxID=1282885 RepID=A0ABW2GH10_9ACTN
MAAVHEASLGAGPGGGRAGARRLIRESWYRARARGVDPECARPAPGPPADVELRRDASGLREALPVLRETLLGAYDPLEHIMLVCDADGVVLWREGCHRVLRQADTAGLAEGMRWSEQQVGTNGMGLGLVARRPVLVHHAEHFARSLHWWTCAAAPVHDPRTGRLLGAVDVSGPHHRMGPAALALVSAAAKVAEGELRLRHWASVDRLRTIAAPLLAGMSAESGLRALAVDPEGWTAAALGMTPPERVTLPARMAPGTAWLPALGLCALEPLPGGWLIRLTPQRQELAEAGRVVLDLRRAGAPAVTVQSAAGGWSRELSPRHAELLYVLAVRRSGLSAAQVAAALFDDATRTVTVRAELSRLRRTFGTVVDSRPYRFADGMEVEVLLPEVLGELLPHSTAPAVLAARHPEAEAHSPGW